jgi:hypothetical protein
MPGNRGQFALIPVAGNTADVPYVIGAGGAQLLKNGRRRH